MRLGRFSFVMIPKTPTAIINIGRNRLSLEQKIFWKMLSLHLTPSNHIIFEQASLGLEMEFCDSQETANQILSTLVRISVQFS